MVVDLEDSQLNILDDNSYEAVGVRSWILANDAVTGISIAIDGLDSERLDTRFMPTTAMPILSPCLYPLSVMSYKKGLTILGSNI
ncbi:MAG: hypothetical protein HRU19_16440 [Pseudobacteriovorax sp.]|nr:hypothetical protein [Pseudobacteriovorax sp.]